MHDLGEICLLSSLGKRSEHVYLHLIAQTVCHLGSCDSIDDFCICSCPGDAKTPHNACDSAPDFFLDLPRRETALLPPSGLPGATSSSP